MRRSNSIIGVLLIAVGILIIALRELFGFKILDFNSWDFWVFIVLLVGLSFELAFFLTGSKPGLLIPGGIITTIALLFIFEVSTNWNYAEYTWPIYIISVAVGLLQMHIFSRREKGLLVSGLIVGGIGAFFLACTVISRISSFIRPELFIPVALIAGGIALFFSNSFRKSQY